MNDKEKRIKEQRLIKAAENNFMGANGKLGSICRYLGAEIKDTRSLYDRYEYSFDDLEDNYDNLPTMDIDDSIYTLGYLFEGISRGMPLEIKYIAEEKRLNVYYKGYEVYREVSGDLECYAPFPEWETLVDKLYKIAQNISRKRRKELAESERVRKVARAKDFLQKLRERWGL